MTEERRKTDAIRNPLLATRNLAWFVFATVIAVVVIQHVALLGLAFAILGGIVLGVFVTREARA